MKVNDEEAERRQLEEEGILHIGETKELGIMGHQTITGSSATGLLKDLHNVARRLYVILYAPTLLSTEERGI